MADLSREELHRLARLGAEARLQELRREEANIRQAFPDLFRAGAGRGRKRAGAAAASASDAAPARAGRRQYRMSATQKKAVSERMKKYWAARRREKERANR
ncbi:MAG TPA: hypothetical protein VIC33_13690 [Vicinamibacterales bacterium]